MKKNRKFNSRQNLNKNTLNKSLLDKSKLALTLLLISFSSLSFGQLWNEISKSTVADADLGDNFGRDIDISGDYAIMGANYDDDFGTNSGSAYIFERDLAGNWLEVQKLNASDP